MNCNRRARESVNEEGDILPLSRWGGGNFPPPSKMFLPVTWTIADVVAMMMVVPWQEAMFAAKVGEPIPKGIITRPRLTTGLVSF